ncbi:tail fiber assembly protein [Buttiauxella sp. 3AFRM03]|uniref:tail fiber assembly protein n=1 Tax=Buttiauxella sp. 3AFRM03 TaxID=2479367 RepID=UPI000EF8193C|nr:tail fiber assembly protein [Buttiauxella sp. 3AFRM03]AYN25787.1 tail fiber assembly protein [Buttiauxella sp. 3AFRM03]
MFYFSAFTLGFYHASLKEDYELAGTFPEDVVQVSDKIVDGFMQAPPEGKMLGADSQGNPAWVDVPPLTPGELAAIASRKKIVLLDEASEMIAPLRDASDGGYIDEADKPKLAAWKKYRYELTKVDTANPVWPAKPE